MAKQIAAVIQWTKKILINTTAIQIKFLSLDIQQEDILVLWQYESKYGTDPKALLELY
jgi:hypothetical protein